MSQPDAPRDPAFWSLLSDADKDVYLRIRSALSAPSTRNKRNRRIEDFREILDSIDVFVNSEPADRWKRCLVCGVCRLSEGIAVNAAQLGRLIFKCKSSINGCLKALGYDVVIARPALNEELLRELPALRTDAGELRQWSVRARVRGAAPDAWPGATPPVAAAAEATPPGFAVGVRPAAPRDAEANSGDSAASDSFSDWVFDF
jgi:hypothetical protein